MYLPQEAKGSSKHGVNAAALPVPDYLKDHYWWAYLHPRSDRVWDKDWMVNLILWGHYKRLRDAALTTSDTSQPVRCLQIACAYGDITTRLMERLAPGAATGNALTVIDIVPKQIECMLSKLPQRQACRTHVMRSEQLGFGDGEFDHALIFFLLHEQPQAARCKTLREALRVLRPGGKLTVVDFARPRRGHPIWLWLLVLGRIEPFAWDLWHQPLSDWLPSDVPLAEIHTQHFFGNWFQCVTMTRADE